MNTISVIIKSLDVLNEMLYDRGYNTKKLMNYTNNDIKKKINDNNLNFEVDDDNKKKIKIIYLLTRIKPSTIKNIIENEYSTILDNSDEIIFITKDLFPQTIYKLIEDYYIEKKYFMQIFNIKNLQFNITKHSFVPEHELLTEEETTDLIKNYNLTSKNQLPFILKKDPVAMYYGMKNGDICKIKRKSETSGFYNCYRLCK